VKLLIDCSFIITTKLNTGIQRVARKVIENIDEVTKDSEYEPVQVVLKTNSVNTSLNLVKTLKSIKNSLQESNIKQVSLTDKKTVLDKNVITTKGDVLLLLDSTWHLDTWDAIQQAKLNGTMIIAVIYDIIPISHSQYCDANLVRLFNQWFDNAIDNVDGFIAISHTVENSLKEYLQEKYPQKVQNKFFDHFLLGADFEYKQFNLSSSNIKKSLTNLYKDRNRSIYLIVCTVEPRKNHKYLLDVFDSLWEQNIDVTLNIVGKKGWMVDALIARIDNHKEFNKRLFHFDNLNDEELNYCYQNSKILLFPSIVEGFGLPIIEGLNNKLPVLASDIPIHKEVGGDKIGYFDINHTEDLVQQIIHIEQNGIPPHLQVADDFKWLNWNQSTKILFEKVQEFNKNFVVNDKELDELIEKVKQKAEQAEQAKQAEQAVIPAKEVYTYEEFGIYNDIEFITNAYRVLLKREPDQVGLDYYLHLLRSGKKTKMEIISLLRFSKEGRTQNVKLSGYNTRVILTLLNKTPILSHLVKTVRFLLNIPKYMQQLNYLQNHISVVQNELKSQIAEIDNKCNSNDAKIIASIEELNGKLGETVHNLSQEFTQKLSDAIADTEDRLKDEIYILEDRLEDKSNKEDTIELYQKLMHDKEQLLSYLNKIDELIEEAKKRVPQEFTQKELIQIAKKQESKFDYLYKSFEDKFRGKREDIKNQLKIYLPFIEKISSSKEDISILDIGCGRGEWLELLKENNYKAKGIDLNSDILKECQKRSLNVEVADALSYLKSLPNNSLSLITGFHIIEHLPSFDMILELFAQSHRVLKPNGMIIFETPNPRNILVGSSDFYHDPSHQNPLHPMTMKFFAQKSGFKDALSLVVNGTTLNDIDRLPFNCLDDYIYLGRNYAIVGSKS